MNKKIIAILLSILIAGILLSGIIYFIMFFTSRNTGLKSDNLVSFQENKELYSNKRQAYDASLKDSGDIRLQNTSLNLNTLFLNQTVSQEETSRIGRKMESIPHFHILSQTRSPIRADSPDSNKLKGIIPRVREGFFTGNGKQENLQVRNNRLHASILKRQTVTAGSLVILMIKENGMLEGKPFLSGSMVYGIAEMIGERVLIHVKSIATEDSFQRVNLSVFDKDGLEGIYIQELSDQESNRESVGNALVQTSSNNIPYSSQLPLQLFTAKRTQQTAILTEGYLVTLSNAGNQ